MMKKHREKRMDPVLVHDGAWWRLYENGALAKRSLGRVEELPEELLLAIEGHAEISIVLAGEVLGLEEVCATRGSFVKEAARLGALAAESVGREVKETVALPMSGTWRGHRGKHALVAAFERQQLEGVREALAEVSAVPAGYASLELALLAVWKRLGQERTTTLLMVSDAHAFVAPMTKIGNAGPHSVAAGLRHFVQDREAWLTRIHRAIGSAPGRLVVFALEQSEELVAALKGSGVADVSVADVDALMVEALTRVVRLRRHSLRAEFPVVNPFAPVRRLSWWWLISAVLLATCVVSGNWWWQERALETRLAAMNAQSRVYLPLQEKVKGATNLKDAAERRLKTLEALRDSLVTRRQPLNLFINVAYFYCRHVGATVLLERFEEAGDRLTVQGFFLDPEDGVKMNEQLQSFLSEHALALVSSVVKDDKDAQERTITRFTYVITSAKGVEK